MYVELKKLKDGATVPFRGSSSAAGCDLCACIDSENGITIQQEHTVKIPTGIALAIPEGMFGAIFARSGLAAKYGLRPANCVGVIDSDYRGEIIVALHNDSPEERVVKNGDRIAQIVFLPFFDLAFKEVDALSETERGDGGFGSTGMTYTRQT